MIHFPAWNICIYWVSYAVCTHVISLIYLNNHSGTGLCLHCASTIIIIRWELSYSYHFSYGHCFTVLQLSSYVCENLFPRFIHSLHITLFIAIMMKIRERKVKQNFTSRNTFTKWVIKVVVAIERRNKYRIYFILSNHYVSTLAIS